MQGESGDLADPVIEGLVTRRQRLQREDLAALLRPNGDAVRNRRPRSCSTGPASTSSPAR